MNENHEALKPSNLKDAEQRLEQLFVIMNLIKKDLNSDNKARKIHAMLSISTFCDFIEKEDGFTKNIHDKHNSIRAQIEKFKAEIH